MPERGKLDPLQLERKASELGFPAESLEKVLRLVELLDGLWSHPYLNGRLALKGGTALNLFLFDLPRLSVDIDLNYIGSSDREVMLTERPSVERAVQAVCKRCHLEVQRLPDEHAGGKWVIRYLRAAGGKLAALFSRSASRDVFDVVRLFEQPTLDRLKLRLAFVVYGAMSRRDFRCVTVDEIEMLPRDAESELFPLLRRDLVPSRSDVAGWCREMIDHCRKNLSAVLPYEPHEVEFLEAIQERGEIQPELLTSETDLQQRIRTHPALRWKALNVQRHHGKMGGGENEPRLFSPKEP